MPNAEFYSKMQTGKPVAVYRKTILGKVEVKIIDPFRADQGETVNVMLEGDPKKNNPKSFVEVWSPKEQVFFERQNQPLFKAGYIEKIKEEVRPEPEEVEEDDYSHFDREYIEELVTAPFMKFKHELNSIDSDAVLYRILSVAEELERPEKTMQHIRQRLTEVQEIVE